MGGAAEVLLGEDIGIIQSVLKALLEEAGGRFDMLGTPSGKHLYRMVFPRAAGSGAEVGAWAGIAEDVRSRIAGWRVLLGFARREDALRPARLCEDVGMTVEIAGDIVGVLQHVEADRGLKVIVVERDLLGEEGDALLRAIRKLRPRTGLVVLDNRASLPADMTADMVFELPSVRPDGLLDAMIRAESLAARAAGT